MGFGERWNMWPSFEKSQKPMMETHLWLHEWDALRIWCDIIHKDLFNKFVDSYSFAFWENIVEILNWKSSLTRVYTTIESYL